MKTAAALAVLALGIGAAPGWAHYPFGVVPSWGGGFQITGRGFTAFGYYRGSYINPYGFMPGYGWPGLGGATIIVTPPPVIVVTPGLAPRAADVVNRLPQVPPPEEVELLRPAPAPPPRRPERAVPPARPAEPPPKEDETQRQVRLGKEALAAGEPGRAAERFGRAAAAAPQLALPRFLLAQALYAVGRYREAVVALHEGLRLDPDWPKARFDPRELYGPNVADSALDLELLRRAVARQPDEPALAFLYGYQLWFNGRRAEARTWLEQAAATAADPAPIRRFLAVDRPEQ